MIKKEVWVSLGGMYPMNVDDDLHYKLSLTHVFQFLIRESENEKREKVRSISRNFASLQSLSGFTNFELQERYLFKGDSLTIGDDLTLYTIEDENSKKWMASIKTVEVYKQDGMKKTTREEILLAEQIKKLDKTILSLSKEFEECMFVEERFNEEVKQNITRSYIKKKIKEDPSLTTIEDLLHVMQEQ